MTGKLVPTLINDEEFDQLRQLVRKEFGIVLKGSRRPSLEAKLLHRIETLRLASWKDYFNLILSDPVRQELNHIASEITNNETYFFREQQQFAVLSRLLADIKNRKVKEGSNSVRFLSLASSTGEEAYSISMTVQESGLFLWDWDIRITGIDIDRDAILRAQSAVYGVNSFRTSDMNIDLRRKYFVREGDKYRVKKHMARNVEFRHGNLISKSTYADMTGIDVIFCRNVMIYMTEEAVRTIAGHLHTCLSDDGYLFVGASDSLGQKTDLFSPLQIEGTIIYRKDRKKPA